LEPSLGLPHLAGCGWHKPQDACPAKPANLAILEKHEKSCQCEIEVSKVQVIQTTAQFNFLLSQAKQCLAKNVAANKKKKGFNPALSYFSAP
jgi:hypothetical protein